MLAPHSTTEIKISVVIPLYNKARHIAHTLRSVLQQASPAAEILVVDDGSTDAGAEIVRGFLDQGVRLIQQPNQGVSAARNRGLQEASYPYVAFLDADDEWLPEHLSTLQTLITEFPQAALWSTFCLIRQHGDYYLPPSGLPYGWRGMVERFFEAHAQGLSIVNSSTACVCKEALLSVGGFPVGVKLNEDYIAWWRLGYKYPVAHAVIVTVIYNQDAENRCSKVPQAALPASLPFLVELLHSQQTPYHHRRGIKACFRRIAIATLINTKINAETLNTKTLLRLTWRSGCYELLLILVVLYLCPRSFLGFLKHRRHRQQRQQAKERAKDLLG
ncbi:glycosyltransferase family A protein [Thermosynechococcus sp. HY213]|uniref:glycosyltransferase family 2 protein n=1 Tax=Thermosynechococcus sp. HY213 TaxID=3074104 RepID=UPI002854966B|nr:glycosyltransferase family A protein [Thermosynechococcus sp. HY213]MDR7920613.1 glycosyltransferase family A protein [Thermosynechococcus sp. HY213]